MADTLNIFGTTYTGVTGIIATDSSDTEKTYVRPQGTKTVNITANGTTTENVTEYASAQITVNVMNHDYEDALVAFGVTEDLADGIEAMTTYANEVTGVGDTNLSDAVRTLAEGYSGGEPLSRSDVNFYDYDGTLLHSFTTAEVNDSGFTMPSNPSHTGLTAQGWNWTLAQLRTQLTAMPTQPVDVGQMYITDDGKTRLYCHFEEGRLHPYLGIGLNGTVVIDWGDGSATSTLTGTSLTEAQVADHVYASGGDYMITLTVSSGSARIVGNGNTTYLLRKESSTSINIHRVYSSTLVKVELGTGINIGNYAFYYCMSLASITIPSGVTSIGNYAFQYCYALSSITIPSGVTSIGSYTFSNCASFENITIPSGVTSISKYMFRSCNSLASITIPSGVTSIGDYAFQFCYTLASITIPSGVTSIGNYTFQTCQILASITIPSGVTSIGNYAFNSNYGLGEIHFKPTTPPTVANANAWSSVPTDCVIYVPAGTLSAYTSAAKYPSSSTYTYIEE